MVSYATDIILVTGKNQSTMFTYLDELLAGGIKKVIWVRWERTAGRLSWLLSQSMIRLIQEMTVK